MRREGTGTDRRGKGGGGAGTDRGGMGGDWD